MKKEQLRHSKNHRPYIMRKVIDVESEDKYGMFFNLECGHKRYVYNGNDKTITLFCMQLPKGATKGCFECGEIYEKQTQKGDSI